ncbi:energy transducer TonB [Telmatospirillum siberiense]|uniref:energy transducer TonB n=1 Tax=Telmatospirillum siberiense TaxID=382514 RepID=UPI001F52FDFB|nr:energy transducer TonB [Telmatospirillum siberiense]
MPVKHGGSSGKAGDLRFGLLCSVALHIVALVIAVFGLPQLLAPPPEISEPVIVEIAELGDKTNPPPKQVQSPKPVEQPSEAPKQEAPPTPEPPKAEPPKPEPPKPEPPKPPEPKPEPPKPEPPKPVPPPKPPEPEPDPVPVPTPKPKPPEPKPPEPQPDVLKDVKPPAKKPPPPTNNDFDSLLKTVDKLRDTSKPSPAPQPQQAAAGSNKTVNSNSNIPSEPVSMTDKDFIAAQFRKCWNFDPGARDAGNLIVRVHVLLNSDGSVVRADIVDDPRYYSDNYYRSAADSARRAVFTCSPIKLPTGKYDALKDLVLNFDPRDSLR